MLGGLIHGYAWLNTSLFAAAGRFLGTGRIEYAVPADVRHSELFPT
jgi:hypothetical protein